MLVLGIETSCDDTAVALVNSTGEIVYNKVVGYLEEHQRFGGIVPEIASRNHLSTLPQMVEQLVEEMKFADSTFELSNINAIAVTYAPGLIGGLIVGVMFAKSLAYALNKPIIPVNHLEGHLLTNRLVYKELEFPFLGLLVSGGHCQFVVVHGVGRYEVIGQTLDDAVGESFDKVARMLGLEYPGGPKVEECAKDGDINAFSFPKPLLREKDRCNLSFSGLKTAVKREVDKAKGRVNINENTINDELRANFCASFQHTVSEVLCAKLEVALKCATKFGIKNFVICGGVSANKYICKALESVVSKAGFSFFNAPLQLCTDNAAMIAWAGIENWKLNNFSKNAFQNFNFAPKSSLQY